MKGAAHTLIPHRAWSIWPILNIHPFLDTSVTRSANGKLDNTVYRKKTYTDIYTHRVSPPDAHRGYLYDWARNIRQRGEPIGIGEPSHEDFHWEWLPSSLHTISGSTTRASSSRELSDEDDKDTEKPPVAFLLYVAGVSKTFRKACRDFSIRASPDPPSAVFSSRQKTPSPQRSNRMSYTKCHAPAARCT